MSYQDKAMLVSMSVSLWGGNMIDKDATQEVLRRRSASGKAARVHKILLPGSTGMKAIRSAFRAATKTLNTFTLPWSQAGMRIMPAAIYLRFVEAMRKDQNAFDVAVEDFLRGYESEIQAAKLSLGDLWDEGDYPSVGALRSRFSIAVDVLPFPSAEDFRVEMAATDAEEIRKSIEARVMREIEESESHLLDKMHDAVQKMVDRLSDPKAIFRDSLVENLEELLELLPDLNIADSGAVKKMARICEEGLTRYSPQELRDSPAARATTAQRAREIADQLADYL